MKATEVEDFKAFEGRKVVHLFDLILAQIQTDDVDGLFDVLNLFYIVFRCIMVVLQSFNS